MPSWYYFSRPSNLAFHDITTISKPPKNLRSLLGLGLKFCPTPRSTPSNILDTTERLQHDLFCKVFYAGKDLNQNDYDPKMYVKSSWTPAHWQIPVSITRRYNDFALHANALFKKRFNPSNLLPHQRNALKFLQQQNEFVIAQCDKNLGPAILEYNIYIRRALQDHLLDSSTYSQLTPSQAASYSHRIPAMIIQWLDKYKEYVSKNEKQFILSSLTENTNPFPVFYITIKIHKNPWATRPIVSCPGSLFHALAIWVDRKLKSIAIKQNSFIASSKDFKDYLFSQSYPSNALLFTADAVSYYTNINTAQALREIGNYLRSNETQFQSTPIKALMSALRLVMQLNIFSFGDTFWHQRSGTAMGTPLRATMQQFTSPYTKIVSYRNIPTFARTNDILTTCAGYGSQAQIPPPTPLHGQNSKMI